jgi:phosphoribosylglycinamide formyltransferase-1
VKIVILISGRGSNMEAILDARLPLTVAAVISNRPGAAGLAVAATRGVPVRVVDHTAYPDRDSFDRALLDCIAPLAPDWVVLAGFMRVLTAAFIDAFPQRILNIHPSLLPAFPGLHTHRQALCAGVRIHGATVHIVTPRLDHGPIVVQAAVPVVDGDTEASLAARVLAQEHRIYPAALRWIAEGRLTCGPDGVVRLRAGRVENGETDGFLLSPEI